MANYSLDIAFDADSNGKGNFQGFLSMGLVKLESDGTNTLASLALLKPNDKISFNIYDITDTQADREPSLPDNWVSFQSADKGGGGDGPGPVPPNLTLESKGSMQSLYFGGPYPRWQVTRGPHAFQLPVNNLGRYFFTVELGVDGETFGCDPEMIVRR